MLTGGGKAEAEDADRTTLEQMLLHFTETAFFPDFPNHVAVAVSGGGDSMALLHLAHRVAQAKGAVLEAVTLDHGLREASAAEARMVANYCGRLGVPHTVLGWRNRDGKGNLAAAAREARYRLIAAWARGRGIGTVALGHTRDDVAETFVMRLARASGVDGLAMMDVRFDRQGITWVRPLWQQDRAGLRAYLALHGVPYVDDPTNSDPAHERARVRQALTVLNGLGIASEAVQHSALSLSMARSALQHYAHAEAVRHVTADHGDVLIPLRPRPVIPEEIRRRLLIASLQTVGGNPFPPRFHAMARLDFGLMTVGKHTLAGCVVTRKADTLRITREWQPVRNLACPTDQVWDGRWQMQGPHAPDLQIRALGEAGLRVVPAWRDSGLPRTSLLASPAIWRKERLVAAPLAGFGKEWAAKTINDRKDLPTFILTH